MTTGSRGQRWATARERTVRLVKNRHGVQVFSRRIVFCITGISPEERDRLGLESMGAEKFAPKCATIPQGWCHVRRTSLSFDMCAECPLNEGFETEETHLLKTDTRRGFRHFHLTVIE